VPPATTLVTVFAGGNDTNTIASAIGAGRGGGDPSGYLTQYVQGFARDYGRLKAALDRLQSTSVSTSLRQGASRRLHRFSWINEWKELASRSGAAVGLELIIPDWLYAAVTDSSEVTSMP